LATNSRRRRVTTPSKSTPSPRRRLLAEYFPAWLMLAVVGIILLPKLFAWIADNAIDWVSDAPGAIVHVGGEVIDAAGDALSAVGDSLHDWLAEDSSIAPLFTEEVVYWEDSLQRWAKEYDLDPNLLATVMQIESCGHPTVASSAGAQGLFQVMPLHFATGEDQLDPDTNARRGIGVLVDCLGWAEGNIGLATACYNGGPSVLVNPIETWTDESQRYYRWATGIYADAQADRAASDTLTAWLEAGGIYLCDQAAAAQREPGD